METIKSICAVDYLKGEIIFVCIRVSLWPAWLRFCMGDKKQGKVTRPALEVTSYNPLCLLTCGALVLLSRLETREHIQLTLG